MDPRTKRFISIYRKLLAAIAAGQKTYDSDLERATALHCHGESYLESLTDRELIELQTSISYQLAKNAEDRDSQ